ncbi:MAG: YcbK family protein [Myxococcales bacterium]|nr:YcbK family protein [Myxococcales bacterium]
MRAPVVLFAALLSLLAGDAEAQQRRQTPSRRIAMSAYRAAMGRWHDPARVPAVRRTDDGRFVLRLHSINGRGTAEVSRTTASTAEAPQFDDAAYAEVARVMSDQRTNQAHPIDRRLVAIVYAMAEHFAVGQVSVVSGYRAESRGSNHALGRAVDVVLPGVSDRQVAEYARAQGFCGVGIYPSSGFVHVDVRSHSFFWVDRSAPGRRSARRRSRRRHGGVQEILGTQARDADRAASARGVSPFGGYCDPNAPAAAPNASPSPADEDDEGEASPPAAR